MCSFADVIKAHIKIMYSFCDVSFSHKLGGHYLFIFSRKIVYFNRSFPKRFGVSIQIKSTLDNNTQESHTYIDLNTIYATQHPRSSWKSDT